MRAFQFLLNPFVRYAGMPALIAGVLIILATGYISWIGQLHLDGVIDLHLGTKISLAEAMVQGMINWLCMALFLYVSGMIFAGSRFRVVDVFGTQALARFPMLVACLANLFLLDENMTKFIEYKALGVGEPVSVSTFAMISFAFLTLIMIVTLIWMIVLMYKGYSISCNLKGGKAITSFIICLILAEALSKFVFYYF